MAKLRIQNFGPIGDGLPEATDGGFLKFERITILLGDQGTGKSTVAKLFSVVSRLERDRVVGTDLKTSDENAGSPFERFRDESKRHDLLEYFKQHEPTRLRYSNKDYRFSFEMGGEVITLNPSIVPSFARILYVPAERQILSVLNGVKMYEYLPDLLVEFADEFMSAADDIGVVINLPIQKGQILFFESVGRRYYIKSKPDIAFKEKVQLPLSSASSGLHSFVPMYIATLSAAASVGKHALSSIKPLGAEEQARMNEEISAIMSDSMIATEIKRSVLKSLSQRYTAQHLINIVEEPEQNLFPTSQKTALFHLLECNNMTKDNTLVITTHSPFIISYLTLAVKAYMVQQDLIARGAPDEQLEKLYRVVPKAAIKSPEGINIYETKRDGTIVKMPDYNGLPTDENTLNLAVDDINDLFTELVRIEQWKA